MYKLLIITTRQDHTKGGVAVTQTVETFNTVAEVNTAVFQISKMNRKLPSDMLVITVELF